MRRALLVVIGAICFLSTGAIRAQSAIAIRAAATTPVSGWQQIASPDGAQVLWVGPTDELTSLDIERAEQVMDSDGSPALAIVFTDDGARKMSALSTTRIGQPIAFLLDAKVIWAPVIRARMEKEPVLSGGAEGLTTEELQRVLRALKR